MNDTCSMCKKDLTQPPAFTYMDGKKVCVPCADKMGVKTKPKD